MGNFGKKIDLIFMGMILELFIFMSMFFLTSKLIDTRNYLMFCITFFLMVLSFYTKPVIGLALALLADILHGGFILFSKNYNFKSSIDGMWFVVFPIIALTSGKLGKVLQEYNLSYKRSHEKLKGNSGLNSLMGFSDKQRFFEDLLSAGKKTVQYKKSAVIIMVKLLHYDELTKLYGKTKIDSAILRAAGIMDRTLGVKRQKYQLEEDTLAAILSYSDIKEVKLVEKRLKDDLTKIILLTNNESKLLVFDVKVESLEYDEVV